MQFNSLVFFVFFPLVLLGYYISPPKARYIFLLFASFVFYMWWNPKYILLLSASIIITYLCGLLIGEVFCKKSTTFRKRVVFFGFACNLGILLFFKYINFLYDSAVSVLAAMGWGIADRTFDVLLPVGISFYTFQALGYIVDVYRGDVKCEKNILKYALFVSFFPQMVAGPIERSGNLLHQVKNIENIKAVRPHDISTGFILLAWGFFIKLVVADRISILVDTVYDAYWNFGSFGLSAATIGFAIQIYCDFAAYSIIAMGAARMMGIRLMENFNTPYLACSVKDFWKRWHISLSTWFRDYLYIPLGGGRVSKSRKYFNIMAVFCVSGLWHGANWTFVAWGAVHGLFQIADDATIAARRRVNLFFNTNTNCMSYRLGQIAVTFAVTCFAWIFFRAASIGDAFVIIGRIFTVLDPWSFFDGELYELGLDRAEMNVLAVGVAVLIVVDIVKYAKHVRLDEFLQGQNLWFRWLSMIALILATVIFGVYGPAFDSKQFIYFQF
jgi:D-alanyl-lipoteichoic acid acyltransferase DltB (MBOAT superfamily)